MGEDSCSQDSKSCENPEIRRVGATIVVCLVLGWDIQQTYGCNAQVFTQFSCHIQSFSESKITFIPFTWVTDNNCSKYRALHFILIMFCNILLNLIIISGDTHLLESSHVHAGALCSKPLTTSVQSRQLKQWHNVSLKLKMWIKIKLNCVLVLSSTSRVNWSAGVVLGADLSEYTIQSL